MILNLDPTFTPVTGKAIKHESFVFAGGEPHIKITETVSSDKVIVTHRINTFNNMGLLLVAIDALRRLGDKRIELYLPYFPAARQDRVMVKGEALTVKIYADLINGLNLEKVTIFDPHSDVTAALVNNSQVLDNHNFIKQVVKDLPNDDLLLVSPDAGAVKKIHKLAAHLKTYEILECGKSRDVATGALSGFKVPIPDLNKRACLIVDDICDGGGTFLGLADQLVKQNAGDLYLAVSHGIFSKGTEILLEKFKTVYSTDSIKEDSDNGIQYLKLQTLYNHEI